LEKAIEIKRRAQRCVQNGDLDGALREYEKLVETPESDPYNFVLLADLLFKKGDQPKAAERYLHAVTAYEKAGLYKNAIAVCKKMGRLSLSQTQVLKHLANLHQLDGLASEASVYYAQFADQMLRANNANEAAAAYRKAFDCGQENVKFLEQMADALLVEGETARAAEALREAAGHWERRGQPSDARRCHDRANLADPATARMQPAPAAAAPAPVAAAPPAPPAVSAPSPVALEGFETGRPSLPFTPVAEDLPPTAGTPGVLTGSRLGLTPEPPASHTMRDSASFERSPSFGLPTAAGAGTAGAGVPAPVSDDEPAAAPEGVYDIGDDSSGSYEHALHEAQAPAPPADPYRRRSAEDAPSPSVIARRPVLPGSGVTRVESLLAKAQEEFRSGRRDAASQALVDAAHAYEELGRLDSAATIFRSLGRGAQAPVTIMEQWLANCEKRGDQLEGSQVACELGDRALNESQEARARGWFEHAAALDPANDTARRRLLRLAPRPAAPAPAPATNGETAGRVEVAVGRGEATTFDLEGLLAEFQRGVDTQLEGDAQGHYDMGMAYREMGLHEQALDSFRIAQRDPRLALLCHEMAGKSLADSGQHEAAVREFTLGLKAQGLDATGEAELRYLTAMSLAALGDPAGAVAQLEIADMRSPGRADVMERLAEWRRAFGKAA
jgi:tetratricopeptide (TPR) repeat protein